MAKITVHILVETEGAPSYETNIGVSETAQDLVRFAFNPSGKLDVDAAKVLAAALVSHVEPLAAARGAGGRNASLAITHAEDAAMHAVKALTA